MKNITHAPTRVESRITEVTVYLSGAQITRTAEISTDMQEVVFGNLPAGLRAESIQASGGNGVSIRSVEHTVNHLEAAEYTKEITDLQTRLKELERKRQCENNKIELGKLEESFFAENRKLAGTESGLKAEELKASVLFYNERMAGVRETRMACMQRLEELEEETAGVVAQLGGFDRGRIEPVSEITVTVAVEKDTDEPVLAKGLALSYFVENASWQPSYDIRAKDTTGNISLHYKASVSQNTGENWEDVKLFLSTGNPSVGGACPEIRPWYLNFYREPQIKRRSAPMAMARNIVLREEAAAYAAPLEVEMIDEDYLASAAEPVEMASKKPASVMTESVTSVEYGITAPFTIASGDGSQDVEITVHSLPAEFRYFSISKLEREVFLLAAVSGWEHLNLIAGEASIFFENRYVGKSYIDPVKAEEKIDLSLGADKSVIVTRVRGKDFTAKALVGGSVKQTRQWELTARNLKPMPIEIEMQDQIPVSINKEIVVDATDISGAEMDKDTGILTWKFSLQPAESKSATVKYVVTYPKTTRVVLE